MSSYQGNVASKISSDDSDNDTSNNYTGSNSYLYKKTIVSSNKCQGCKSSKNSPYNYRSSGIAYYNSSDEE